VLTAGCAWQSSLGAADGVLQLRQDLQQTAAGLAPKIVVGGGVSLANVALLRGQFTEDLGAAAHYSFHCYSAVLTDGRVDQHKVAALVATAAIPQIIC